MNELENKYLYIINNVLQGYDRDIVVNHVAELEQQKAEDKEFIEILCRQQAESALEYNKLMNEKVELIKIIQWIVDSVYPSDVDAFKLGIRHSLSAEHWIETVNSRFNSIKTGGER